MSRSLLLVLLATVAFGCESPVTQLVVLVDSDFEVPTELTAVDVVTRDSRGEVVSQNTFALAPSRDPEAARFTVPFSFALVPVGDDPSRRVDVVATGLDAEDNALVTRRAVTGFLEEETLLLPLFLLRSCRTVMCPEGQTCTEQGCSDVEVPIDDLRPVRPGDEKDAALSEDAGPMDAGPVDAGPMDAGPMDAGPMDAGPMDAGPVDGGGADSAAGGVRYVRHAGSVSCGDTLLSVTPPTVPVGRTLLLSIAMREGGSGPVTATDTAGNTYDVELATEDTNPRLAVLSARVDQALGADDRIDVTIPTGSRASSVVVDELAGVGAVERLRLSSRRSDRSTTVDLDIPAEPGSFVYGIVANANHMGLTVSSPGWTESGTAISSCGGGIRNMDHRTYYTTAVAETTLEAELPASELWAGALVEIAPE